MKKKQQKELKSKEIYDKKKFQTKQHVKKKRDESKKEREELFKTFTKQEQFSEYFDSKKLEKTQGKLKAKEGLEKGLKVLIDFSFENDMDSKEISSLCLQICICSGWMKRIANPVSLNLVNCKGIFESTLIKMGLSKWFIKAYQEDILEIEEFNKKKEELIYLSPDAEEELETIEKDKVYIIGGLVDKTVRKFASLIRARALNIKCAKLPIAKFMGLTRRKPLNIDTVVLLLAEMVEVKDWEKAFLKVCPKRLLLEEENKEEDNLM